MAETEAKTAVTEGKAVTEERKGRQGGLDQDGQDHRGRSQPACAAPVYKRIVSKRKKFYAHDEERHGEGWAMWCASSSAVR